MQAAILNFFSQENFVLKIIFALFLFSLGWLFAKTSAIVVKTFFKKSRIFQILKRIGAEDALKNIDPNLSFPVFFSEFLKYFLLVIVLIACSEILGLLQFSKFLSEKIFDIFLNIFIASIIFIIAAFLSDLSQKIFVASVEKEKIVYSKFLGSIISKAVWTLAILAILYQLKIASNLILIAFFGVVFFLSLSLAIAVGLGAKDFVKEFLKEKLKK